MNNDKPQIAERIKFLRKEKGYTQEQLAEILGLNAKSSIANYESGANSPSDDIKIKMCEIFNCTIDYLLGLTNIREPIEGLKLDGFNDNYKKNIYELYEYIQKQKKTDKDELISSKYYMCPVYGHISAGQPNWAEECIEGRIPIDSALMNIINPEECFFLIVNGESMNKEIKNGAYALIRKTDFVENGEIAVVLVNGNDATLKKFSKQGDLIILEPMSNDPSFTTQVYNKDTEIKVIGKYIGKMEMK